MFVIKFVFIILPRLVFLLLLAGAGWAIYRALRRRKNHRVFLALSAVLLVLFMADAVLARRSIPGHLLRWVAGEPSMALTINDYFEDTRNTIDPQELQRWAVAMIQEYPQTDSSVVDIPLGKLPAYIRNPNGFYLKDHYIQAGAVYLGWGGGLSHFGLCVGSPTFKIAAAPDDPSGTSYVEWKPGIYFWTQS